MTSVAVMLPARIETRFDTDRGGAARLRVIVIPADVWFDRHDPRVSQQDIEALRVAAQACDGDLFGQAGIAAFERLAGQVGAGRAAWLGTTLLTRDAGGWNLAEPDVWRAPGQPAAPRMIRGLPGLVEVWATLADSREIRLATLRPKPELRVEPDVAGGPATFWPRWGVLKRAGLTATINLSEVDGGRPIDPADIAVLTVLGLGTADPARLLSAHRHAGAASLMPPGSPTNNTAEASYRPPGPLDWRHAAVATSEASQQLGDAIGAPVSLPGADDGHRNLQSLLVSALWPALWGHALQDLAGWPTGEDAGRIRSGLWWPQYVFPEGPFPSLLVGDQPYGVLPATIVAKLAGSGGPAGWAGQAVGAHLAEAARRAESGVGTVVDANTDQVLKVLAHTPVSTGHRYRWSVPAAYLGGPLKDAHLNRLAEVLDPMGVDATGLAGAQIALGSSAPLDLPLLDPGGPDEPPNWVHLMLDDLLRDVDDGVVEEADFLALEAVEPKIATNRHRLWLLRLIALCRRHAPEVGLGAFTGVLESLRAYEVEPALLVRLVVQSLRVAHGWPPDDGAADEVYRNTLEAARGLALRPVRGDDGVQRALAATMDCATHRVDALPAAAAMSTLDAMADAPRVLGLYGWVDSPLRGEPGFGKDRAVLAPSPAQAKAAAIIKDRYVTHAESGLAPVDAWDLGLNSRAVRRAVGLLDAVAEGAHPGEALGRLVEACFERYPDVLRLRGGDPAGPPGGYPADGDAPLRRTCDGLAAMRDWAGDRPAFAARTGLVPGDFGPQVTAELDALAAVPEVVADLHLLEAVHDTVQGGSAVTAQALDSLAGLGEVPELRSLRTPVPGTPLTTRVQLCLPAVAEPADPQRAALADPAVAALLDSLGAADDPVRFGWRRGDVVVTLADLGLAPSDLAALDDAGLLTAVELGWPGGDPTMPSGVEDVRRVLAVLSRCSPSPGPIAEVDELRQRYAQLRTAVTTLVAELRAAGAADDPALRARALRWGLAGDFNAGAEIAGANLAQCPPVADLLDDDLVPALRRLAAIGRGHSDAVVVPVLTGGATPTPLDLAPDAVHWQQAFSHVRPALSQFHEALGARVTATYASGWGPGWTGQMVPGTAALPGAARELAVVYGLDSADPANAVSGVVDQWQETLPGRWSPDGSVDRAISATAAFGFATPGARPQQAILLAVPPSPDIDLDLPLLRQVLTETRLLVRVRALRGRDLGPLGALLPSALLRADAAGGIVLDDSVWNRPTNDPGLHVRLEQGTPEGDVDLALQARTADPLWMMTRQWELGEHQGADASSPVWARARVKTTPLKPPVDRRFADPARLSGAAVLEAASRDWPGAVGTADPFDTEAFVHTAALRGGGATFLAPDHPGGQSDWWSVDAHAALRPAGRARTLAGLPGRMRYPGAPAPGWCTLEDPGDSVTAHLPDTAHVGSLFFLDVLAGHATDWYLMPLPTDPARVLSVGKVTVVDSFGDPWVLPEDHWGPVDRWNLFGTDGLGPSELLLWAADAPPLEGPVLERVVLGVDEDANLLWAVEETVEAGQRLPDAAESGPPASDNTAPRVGYRPLSDSPPRWHPYPADDAAEPRRFRQGRLASGAGVTDLPLGASRILPTDHVHEIVPAAIPARGLQVQRRWVLARDADGRVVLWQQHTRRVPLAPPALRLPFDVITSGP